MYEERFYRKQMLSNDLIAFNVTEYETDLQILAKVNLEDEARILVNKYRSEIEAYIKRNPEFLSSLVPLAPKPYAPTIVKHMCKATKLTGVGPMAAVAGALSQYVGSSLLKYSNEIIIENGGDIYLNSEVERQILIYAGNSPFSNKVALKIPCCNTSLGICTSSGTLGHSLSFGKADAVVILSKDTLLSDAAATAVGNLIKSATDMEKGFNFVKSIKGLEGVVIIVDGKLGAWGNVTLIKP